MDRKTAAVVYADLRTSALGIRSRAGDSLAGVRVLARTVGRLQQADLLDQILVFCPTQQHHDVTELLGGATATVHALEQPIEANTRIRRRKWALESWRGGLAEATQFDEQRITGEMLNVLQQHGVSSVLAAPAEAVLIDPELISGMIEHHYQFGDQMRFTFSQAAPGLLGSMYRVDLLGELLHAKAYISDLLAYKPAAPQADLVTQECCYQVDQELCTSLFRYLADTERGFAALESVLAQTDTAKSNGQNARWSVQAMSGMQEQANLLPRELEVEINTAPSLRITDYPHRTMSQQRGPMTLEQFRKIVTDCSDYDDICLTLGGFGEPLAHPDLLEMIRTAKAAGIFGINIETDGRPLTNEMIDALLATDVDTVSVYLDAHSRELYRQLKGEDCFEQVVAQIETFIEKSKALAGGPAIVPHLVKTRATMAEMEAFYDHWLTRCGCAVIVGFNDFAGQINDEAVMEMSPPQRWSCGRLFRCMSILADGTVTMCGQDFGGKFSCGNVFEQSVRQIWRGEALEQLRQGHRQGQFDGNALCPVCKEWHR